MLASNSLHTGMSSPLRAKGKSITSPLTGGYPQHQGMHPYHLEGLPSATRSLCGLEVTMDPFFFHIHLATTDQYSTFRYRPQSDKTQLPFRAI